MPKLKARLDALACERNDPKEHENPDPLWIAKRDPNEYRALVCALFAYGNVKAIVSFLESLDFSLLDASPHAIKEALQEHYYRFQNAQDITALFIALATLKRTQTLESIFMQGYLKRGDVLEGVFGLIEAMYHAFPYASSGYRFLVGSVGQKSPYKRWMMFLRWMVRSDHLDMGLWKGVNRADLLLPLDTHTFKVCQTLGLLKRKSYDLKAVIEATQALKKLDPEDPIKYDFALYRLGQEKGLELFEIK